MPRHLRYVINRRLIRYAINDKGTTTVELDQATTKEWRKDIELRSYLRFDAAIMSLSRRRPVEIWSHDGAVLEVVSRR
jgi:hypothetical protein